MVSLKSQILSAASKKQTESTVSAGDSANLEQGSSQTISTKKILYSTATQTTLDSPNSMDEKPPILLVNYEDK